MGGRGHGGGWRVCLPQLLLVFLASVPPPPFCLSPRISRQPPSHSSLCLCFSVGSSHSLLLQTGLPDSGDLRQAAPAEPAQQRDSFSYLLYINPGSSPWGTQLEWHVCCSVHLCQVACCCPGPPGSCPSPRSQEGAMHWHTGFGEKDSPKEGEACPTKWGKEGTSQAQPIAAPNYLPSQGENINIQQ